MAASHLPHHSRIPSQNSAEPKRGLDAPHVVLAPVPPRRLLLTHRHAAPLDPHHRHGVDVVLVEPDLQLGEVARRPLRQPPLLHNLRGRGELRVLAADVPAEDLKLGAHLRAAVGSCGGEELGRGACEGGDARGRRQGLIEFGGRGAEFLGRRDRRRVHAGALAVGLRGRCGRVGGGAGLVDRRARVDFRGGQVLGRVLARCVLDVLAVLVH